jgi:tetratricopeptide (TPR) repeat protein
MRMIGGWGALALLLAVGCASAPIKKADQASLAVAETRLLDGCYRCLLEARDTFERVAVGKARPLVVARLFETYVLIGLREREVAQDGRESFAKARALVPELPATYGAARYVDLAEVMPTDFAGTPRTELTTFMRQAPPAARLKELKSGLETGEASAPFRAYLSASLDCLASFANRGDLSAAVSGAPAGTSLLVKYRLGTCPILRTPVLEELLEELPEFVEAGLFLARQPTLNITATYIRNMRTWLSSVRDVFPRSSSVTYGLGAMNQIIGDCKAAIRFYEDTIALKERHEDAAMQRVVCLGHIGQFVPAIEGATRIIERGYYNMADAYYWRAWNRHRRQELPEARADIDMARRISVNVQVLTLGGVIKYDQDDLDLAERDLNDAVRMDSAQCIAEWYLGLVAFKKADWPGTSTRFGVAARCYEKSANENVGRLEAIRNSDHEPDFKASQIAGFQAVIKEDRDQQWASVLNAANGYARSEQTATALEWLDRIPPDALVAPRAAELRKLIGGTLQ